MKESVAVAKEADAKKGVSPIKSDKSIQRLRNEPERQLGSLRDVIGIIRRNGGTPSVDSIATELSNMPTAQRAPAIMALQQTHGNRYVQRVVAGIQAKLVVGQPGDIYEREADRVADHVMRMAESPLQRASTCGASYPKYSKEQNGQERLQRQLVKRHEKLIQTVRTPEIDSAGASVRARQLGPALELHLGSVRRGGQSLSSNTRAFMETRFGRDFSDVRIHADGHAARLARLVDARAFTLGTHIVFGNGQYSPDETRGQHLIAHELTHVLQQEGKPDSPLVQRVTGAGNCALPTETVDEQRDELARAGRIAHSQIQGFFAASLSSEVPIPRATKAQRAACPPSGTPIGRADFWRFGGGLANVQVGEIKSINGRAYAVPDVDHYRTRLRELAGRLTTGSPCPGPAGASDRDFDTTWLGGNIARGQVPRFNALNSVVPSNTPARLGPFWGDPLNKELSSERRGGGAVLYWCTDRNLQDDERERERQRLRIPHGERERRTAPQPVPRAPTVIQVHPGFREIVRQLPGQVPGGRNFILTAPEPLFTSVDGAMRMRQQMQRMQVPIQRHPIFQFRTIVWSTLAVTMAISTVGMIVGAVGAAVPLATGAAVGGGAVAAGGGTATGGVVISLFTAAASEEVAKAAAVLIVVGSLAAGASEAQAATAVQSGMSDPQVIGAVDVTDDPFALAGGFRTGSHITIDGRPYRVIGRFHSQ